MTWSRFDDAARNNPKAVLAGNEAWTLWCAAVMYCNQHLTDGFVPDVALATSVLPNPISRKKARILAERLCNARVNQGRQGLFERDDKRGGYVVHDFLDWNPSKAQIEAKRKKDRDRKRVEFDSESTRIPRGIPEGLSKESSRPSRAPAGAHARARTQPSPAQPSPLIQPDAADPKTGQVARATGPPRPAAAAAERPKNLPEALGLPLQQRAEWALRDEHLADYLEPSKWPEVTKISSLWGSRISTYSRDSGVRMVVARFADGYSADELARVSGALQSSSWAQQQRAAGRKIGMSSLTAEVVRRELESATDDVSLVDSLMGGSADG